MPFYDENEDENEDLVANGGAPTTGAGSSTIGTSGGSGSTDVNAPKAAVAAPSTFAGIKDYVNANKNQTAGLANDVGGLVNNYGNEARTKINEGVNQFNQAVDQNTVNLDDRVFNTAKTKAQDVTSVQPDLDTFIGMRDAEYKGPTSFEGSEQYQPAQQAYTTAQQAINNTQSDAGQRQLLSELQQSQRGKVNQGSLALNSALLQGDTNARSILDNVKSQNDDVEGLFNTKKVEADQKALAGKTATEATRKAIDDNFRGEQGVQSSLEKELGERSQDLIGQSNQRSDDLINSLQNGASLTDQQISSLGISKEQYANLVTDMNLLKNTFGNNSYSNITPYATKVGIDGQITAQNAATAEEYARYQALNELMGSQNQFLNDPSLAGQAANVKLADFDINNLAQNMQGGINSAQARLDAEAARLYKMGAYDRGQRNDTTMWHDLYPSYQAYLNAEASTKNIANNARAATAAANAQKATNFQAIQDFLNSKK